MNAQMKRHRADKYQSDYVTLLRDCGVSVVILSQVGDGVTDLLLGYRGETDLAEVKNGETNWKYTTAQEEFRALWRGKPPLLFDSLESVMRWMRIEVGKD